jgi:hypothetical protein
MPGLVPGTHAMVRHRVSEDALHVLKQQRSFTASIPATSAGMTAKLRPFAN